MQTSIGLLLSSMALGLNGYIYSCNLEPILDFFGQRCVQSLVCPTNKCVFV
jgi:hypothetical protein